MLIGPMQLYQIRMQNIVCLVSMMELLLAQEESVEEYGVSQHADCQCHALKLVLMSSLKHDTIEYRMIKYRIL